MSTTKQTSNKSIVTPPAVLQKLQSLFPSRTIGDFKPTGNGGLAVLYFGADGTKGVKVTTDGSEVKIDGKLVELAIAGQMMAASFQVTMTNGDRVTLTR